MEKSDQSNQPNFKPSWDTCYFPRLSIDNKCNECSLNGFALCKMHPNYKQMKEEFDKKHEKRKKD
ncbi:MAG: hypothetical protein LLF98_01840 [Clostridium sp.]|uniref:hypothetical protein n=1 Tax=Clostridium sp. TaxID=1506 RepID=UPI0025C6D992|nr:hypothetical protein [Clostridium sp.]MCE5220022.1 hypothetical protein [Clostridium sp.]